LGLVLDLIFDPARFFMPTAQALERLLAVTQFRSGDHVHPALGADQSAGSVGHAGEKAANRLLNLDLKQIKIMLTTSQDAGGKIRAVPPYWTRTTMRKRPPTEAALIYSGDFEVRVSAAG
jgi:hypothetical protein